jgi:hypothetical protein
VNKKKQKNFINLGYGRLRRQRPWPSIKKVFAPLFSKSGPFLFPSDKKRPHPAMRPFPAQCPA